MKTEERQQMSSTKMLMTLHWKAPDELKELVDKSNGLYCPVFGGGKQALDALGDEWMSSHCIPDDERKDNISHLNQQLNEMTSLYLIYKNLGLLPCTPANIGHVHYRRYFTREDLADIDTADGIIATPVSLGVFGFHCSLEK